MLINRISLYLVHETVFEVGAYERLGLLELALSLAVIIDAVFLQILLQCLITSQPTTAIIHSCIAATEAELQRCYSVYMRRYPTQRPQVAWCA